ncbi:hypothetical protein M409DRAFT_17384 [Zasmidium cellare ATCC 36951]|uniref:Uncharacterized protein n=1 Tax=Zasmidium cellare ATCC 36951 TaxID=1080233 RepID=A0A6A6CY87_ZASCE|nr:uncharacterized protein M409DRAFT_17384 [Zasmidium cellare ATCC 36951]KAF2172144.1 hypothetical protein M409DRAFT_17384 [Zasmidium cellare ATCC 36951]
MANFNDQIVEALLTPSCQDPFIIQLRTALDSIDEHNQNEVSAIVDNLLSNHPASTHSMTFDHLMQRLTSTTTEPSQAKEVDDLSNLMCSSTIQQREPTGIQRAAYGLGPSPGFVPAARNEFYFLQLSFDTALTHMMDIFRQALVAVRDWDPKNNHGASMHFVRKAKNPDHPIRRIRRHVWHVCEFVHEGRVGWRLIDIPFNFYDDLLPLLTDFVNRMQAISIAVKCALLTDIVTWADRSGLALDAMRMARIKTELESKEAYMKSQADLERHKLDGDLKTKYQGMDKMGLTEKGASLEDILGIEALDLGAPALDDDDDFGRAILEALDDANV